MKTITVLAHKGGTGKTTIATALYFAFLNSSVKTCIIDKDPQRSLTVLNRLFNYNLDLKGEGSEKIEGYQISIIDTPPYYIEETNDLVKDSDLVIIPTRTTTVDVVTTIQVYNKINHINPNCFVLLNAIKSGTNIEQIEAELENSKVNMLESLVFDRVAFQHVQNKSGNIFKSGDQKAIDEIITLSNEIYNKLIK